MLKTDHVAQDRVVETEFRSEVKDSRSTDVHMPAGQAKMTPEHQSAGHRREGTV
jgi:hypothetical protein